MLLGPDDASVAVLADALATAGVVRPEDDVAGGVVALNDAVLQRDGAEWTGLFGPRPRGDDPAAAPGAGVGAEDLAQARGLLSRLGRDALALVADPRVAAVPGLWDEALRMEGMEPVFLLVLRDAKGVAAEMRGRGATSRARAHLLWTRRMLAAEAASRGARRVVVSLGALVDDPAGELDRIERRLDVRLPDRSWSASAALEARLDGVDPGAARPPPAGLGRELAPVTALWSHLAAAAQDSPENEDTPARTAAWFEDQARLLAPLLHDAVARAPRPAAAADPGEADALTARAEQAEARVDALNRERDLMPDRLREAQEAGRIAAARVEVLESALLVARRRAGETEATLQARASEADAERREARRTLALEQEAARVAQAEAEERLRSVEHEAQAERSGREAEFGRDRAQFAAEDEALRGQLALTAVELDATRTRARSLAARLDEMEARRSRPGLRAWLARRLSDG